MRRMVGKQGQQGYRQKLKSKESGKESDRYADTPSGVTPCINECVDRQVTSSPALAAALLSSTSITEKTGETAYVCTFEFNTAVRNSATCPTASEPEKVTFERHSDPTRTY